MPLVSIALHSKRVRRRYYFLGSKLSLRAYLFLKRVSLSSIRIRLVGKRVLLINLEILSERERYSL